MDWIGDVKAFHDKYSVPLPKQPQWDLDSSDMEHRGSLLCEEYQEYVDAVAAGDLVETIDAIGDMIYVLIGTALRLGVNLAPVWEAIHESNMQKIPPEKPGGKVQKPAGWVEPNIRQILEEQWVWEPPM